MTSRRKQREQATALAEEATKRADELQVAADEARAKYDAASSAYEHAKDFRDEAVRKADEAERAATAAELAAKTPDLDACPKDMSQKDYQEQLNAAAAEARKDAGNARNVAKSRELTVTSARKERDDTRAAYRKAKKEADDARVDADRLQEEALDWEQTVTTAIRFIGWDGVCSEAGECNSHYPETVASRRFHVRRGMSEKKVLRSVAARLDGDRKEKLSASLAVHKIGVRVVSCPDTFTPIEGRLTVKLNALRLYLAQSLLIRIYDSKTAEPVYQEVLDADGIDKLPRGERLASKHHAELTPRIDACRAHARADDSPYKAVVWVARKPDAFDGLALDKDPVEKAGRCVNDHSDDTHLDPPTDGDGVNKSTAKGARILCAALMRLATAHGEERFDRPFANTLQQVEDGITAANTRFGDLRTDELRVFLGPEWNFQVRAYPWTFSSTQKDTIIEETKTLSNNGVCAQWFIMPGTVLWGDRDATTRLLPVFNTAPCVYEGSLLRAYQKKQWGLDTKIPQHIHDHCLLEVETPRFELRNDLNKGKVHSSLVPGMAERDWKYSVPKPVVEVVVKDVRWHIKPPDGSDEKHTFVVTKPAKRHLVVRPGEFFAMALPGDSWADTFTGLSRDTYDVANCFEANGVKLGIDICADHKSGRCISSYYEEGETGVGAGADNGLDVYLFTSADVARNDFKCAARTGGYIFHCDGYNKTLAGYRTVARALSVADMGKVCVDTRAACDPTKRGTDIMPIVDPNKGKSPPTVRNERLEGETITVAGTYPYELMLFRCVLVEP
jgi:hypothetical protein